MIEVPLMLMLAYAFFNGAGPLYASGQSNEFPFSPSTEPGYLSGFLYLATVVTLAALVFVVSAFFRRVLAGRWRLLLVGNVIAALGVGLGVGGDVFLNQVWSWTNASSGGMSFASPTAAGVFSGILVSLAAGSAAALLPSVVVFQLRRQLPAAAPSSMEMGGATY